MGKNSKMIFFVFMAIAVIGLLVFEIFFFNNRKEVDEKTAKLEEQIEEIKSTTVYSEKEMIYNYLNEVVDLMNKKDYKTLYGMLKDDYKSYLFSDYSNFEKYIQKYAAEEYIPKYNSYYRNKNKYIIITDFLLKEYNRNDLVNGIANKYDIITVEKNKDGELKFALGNFIECNSNSQTKKVDDIEFAILRTIRYAEETEATILVKNNSDENIYIENKNISANVEGGRAAVISSLPITVIKPGAALIIDFEVAIQYDSMKELKGCTFTGIVSESGKIYDDVTVSMK